MGEEFGYYMSCDMPGPWDAECAVLYVNMQWQSLAIVGNRAAIEQVRRWAPNSPAESETIPEVWASCPEEHAHEQKPEICST